MAAKKKVESGNLEKVPAPEENQAAAMTAAETGTGQQAEDTLSGEAEKAIVEQDVTTEKGEPQAWESAYREPPVEVPEKSPEAAEAGTEKQPETAEPGQPLFQITCRNDVSGMIGGVMFVDGIGYTRDAYAASWFANKDGYKVVSE
ncbi:MAG: hypothetical protein NC123_16425 [Butyrivibrio sp.]|nr:hypothetical protein [Acetatifactor muris]MCM1561105.1 hypothetical protein [Butyrivibrio sp.]